MGDAPYAKKVEGSGRVPHVRPSVHGPKKMGEARRLLLTDRGKAFEENRYRPTYPDFLHEAATDSRVCGFH
jgi:hypothetical protein